MFIYSKPRKNKQNAQAILVRNKESSLNHLSVRSVMDQHIPRTHTPETCLPMKTLGELPEFFTKPPRSHKNSPAAHTKRIPQPQRPYQPAPHTRWYRPPRPPHPTTKHGPLCYQVRRFDSHSSYMQSSRQARDA